MRKSSKFLAMVLSVLMLVSMLAVGTSAKFTDVPENDAALNKAVSLLASLGITKGTTETTFGTSEFVTRQQMAAFIYRLMKEGKSQEGGTNDSPFTDLEDPTFFYMVSWANSQGIIKGTSATTFNPKGNITLQDAYVMLIRALGYEKKNGAYGYPFGYINEAEKIGLDEDIPASVGYTTKLTRGNVAILLNNAFYADMATGETGYKPVYKEIEGATKRTYVKVGEEPYSIPDTIAKDIYGVEKTIQRIVATPNYRLDDYDLTRSNDTEFVTFELVENDPEHKDDKCLGTVAFADLGLEGKADDYFLSDVVAYTKEVDDKTVVLAADSLLVKKTGIKGGSIKYGKSTASKKNGGYYPDYDARNVMDSSWSPEKRYSTFTGKVEIDGTTGYFFDAPWAYAKTADYEDKDSMNIRLINLFADEDADPDDDDYVPSFNFKADTDIWGRGDGDYYDTEDFVRRDMDDLASLDMKVYPLYSVWGMYEAIGWFAGWQEVAQYEVDTWDCNGDGRVDFIWYKPYTFGYIETGDDNSTVEAHGEEEQYWYSSVMDKKDANRTKIYTHGATVVNGEAVKDGDFVIAYVNGPANYVKISNKVENPVSAVRVTKKYSTDNTKLTLSNGKTLWFWSGSLKYFGAIAQDGVSQAALSYYKHDPGANNGWHYNGLFSGEKILTNTFNTKKDCDLILYNDTILWISGSSSLTSSRTDYVYIIPTKAEKFAFTTSAGVTVNGIVQSKIYIDIFKNGKEISVPVKIIGKGDAEDNRPQTPAIGGDKSKGYDFSEYVNKPLVSHTNSAGEYYFDIVDFESDDYGDISVLEDDSNADLLYGFVASPTQQAAFVKSGNYYKFTKKGVNDINTAVAPSPYVRITDDTRIVLKVYDDDEEKYVWKEYNSKKLPKLNNTTMINDIQYVVRNNPKSTKVEDLVFLYGVIEDEGTTLSKVIDLRVVNEASTKLGNNDTEEIYYDVFDPFTAKLERGYKSATNDPENLKGLGELVLLSDKEIADDIVAGSLTQEGDMCTSDVSASDIRRGAVQLGYTKVIDFSEDDYILIELDEDSPSEVDTFQVTDETRISFIDFTDTDAVEIKEVDKETLRSESATYRNGADKTMKVFVSSERVKNEDYEKAVLVVIVKDEEVTK